MENATINKKGSHLISLIDNVAFTSAPPVNKNFQIGLETLDETQRATIESTSENILIKAPAGAGKTRTLITAIAAYRYENINDRICAITYTRAAKAEMEERLNDMGIYDVEVTTIHVWSRNILEKMSKKYGFQIAILREADIMAILEEISRKYALTHGGRKVNLGILQSWISGNKLMEVTDGYRRTLIALEERYIKYKRDHVLYDFTDYPLYLYNVLTQYKERIKDIDALFVDEVQDVDAIQLDLFNLADTKKKFFIGDFWQSIFIFRGADASVFNKLNDAFALYKLKFNYRSYQVILDYANTVYEQCRDKINYNEDYSCFITECDDVKPTSIKCERGDQEGSVTIFDNSGGFKKFAEKDELILNEEEVSKSRSELKKFIDTYYPMILCRTNKQVKEVKSWGYNNVSTIHQAKGLEYDNVIVVDFEIDTIEELNIAYVALTRARDNLLVIDWNNLYYYWQGGYRYGY